MRYEVILAEPNIAQVQAPKQNVAPKPSSAEEIAEKLKAAEERRLVSFECRDRTMVSLNFHRAELGSEEDLRLERKDGED